MICPECMGTLAVATPTLAKCTTHGGVYRILFQRGPREAASPARQGPLACARHPDVATEVACARCGAGACSTCAFLQPSGSALCPDCASGRMLGIVTPRAAALNARCSRHPENPAVEHCANCHTPICATCDFSFDGGLHLCPSCATGPATGEVSSKRKWLAAGAYALAVWSTLAFLAFFVAAASMADDPQQAEALGNVMGVLIMFPALAGLGLGFGAVDRNLTNPWWIWGGGIWNALVVGGFMLLLIVGTVMG